MSLGNAWDFITPGSTTILNNKTITYGSGTYLVALDKTKHKLLVCTSSSAGLIVDHVYLCNAAADSLIDITTLPDVIQMFLSSPKFLDLALTRTNDLQIAQWNQTLVTSGTVANDTDGTTGERSLKLLTGSTSGGAATLSYPHLSLNFAESSMFQFKVRLSATTALALHSGVGADDVTAADSNTRKYNAEVCTVTNTNWFLRSADGSANSTSDTGTAFDTSRVGIRIEHYPTLGELDMYIGTGDIFQKTSNVPTSGATADNNLIKHSLKNSANADKNAFIYGSRLAFTITDEWA